MNNLGFKQQVVEKQYEKPEYEKLVDDYIEADKQYTAIEEQFMDGTLLRDILGPSEPGALPGIPTERIVDEFKIALEEMKKLLEDRNTKLSLAKNALRAAVQLGPSQFRGPAGKPSIMSYGPFSVSSVTRRGLNPQALMEMAAKRGFLEKLSSLKTFDKDGKEYPLVKTTTSVDYEGVVSWMKQNGMGDLVEQAYEEKDVTPAVKGPKKLAFLGEKKEE